VLSFTTTTLPGASSPDGARDLAATLEAIPPQPGVGQIVGPEGRNLVIGRAAHLRRWAASHLGAGKPPRKGLRPPTDLRPVAVAVRHAVTTSAFQQRLVYERLMAQYVPLSKRRDLKPPGFLRLDASERFPRVTVGAAGGDRAALFGPFRDRRAAERALKALHKLFPLRPCDYEFEPEPALALGLGCLYAQVRSCAAPCLQRITEDAYRGLGRDAAAFLARPEQRAAETTAWIPAWVARADAAGLVVEQGSAGLELYAVAGGSVLGHSVATSVDEALAGLGWSLPSAANQPDDGPWFTSWLCTPRRTGAYLIVDPVERGALAAAVALVLARETSAKT
jgi:hypothetical protein